MTTDLEAREGDAAESGTSDDAPAPDDGEAESLVPSDLPVLAEETGELEAVEDRRAEYEGIVDELRDRPHHSSMFERLGWIFRLLSYLLFSHVLFETRCIDNIRDAAERGRVVYLMRSRSLFDYLYFNVAFDEHDLPLARFANGVSTAWLRGPWAWIKRLFSSAPADDDDAFQALVHEGDSVFLFLERSGGDDEDHLEFSQKYLTRLIRAQRASDEPIYVLPLLLIWEKRPDPKRAGFIEEIFGTAQSPGFTRKVVGFVQTVWQSFLKLGQPMVQVSSGIELGNFLREYPNAGLSDASDLLRERLMDHLEQERHAILGPTEEPRDQLHREILQRPEVTGRIAEIAEENEGDEEVDEETLRERVRDQLDEIAAEPSLLMIKFFSSFLSLLWYRIYDGFEIDREGLEQVREAARSSSVVLVPSHKSHIDYLVISYIFYQYGLRCPLIAAGENLDFWPLGPIFRRAGAFFIRRSFTGEALYPTVFREYLIRKLEQGYPVEFFIEGTRSRTGKLVKPKYGMLDMIVRAHASGRLDPVKIVPISVGYEKIIEERSYRDELLGAEKEGESLGQLLKTPKVLTSEYGRLYVQFGDPIDVGDYLAEHGVDPVEPDDGALDDMTVRLAHRINYDINAVSIVTPSALVAMVLLNNPVRGTDRRRFLRSVGFLIQFLRQERPSARLSNPLEDALQGDDVPNDEAPEAIIGDAVDDVLDEAMQLFEGNEQVEIVESRGDLFYSVPDEDRLELAYYRNNIVHHFVLEALLATALHRLRATEVDVDALREETYFLSKLFKYEWIYEESTEFENVFRRTLECFDRSGWVDLESRDEANAGDTESGTDEDGDGDGESAETRVEEDEAPSEPRYATVHIRGRFPVELKFFRRMILSFLESYANMAMQLSTLEGDEQISRRDLAERALEQGKDDYLRGRILYYESLSKPTFKNALRLFEDWDLLERTSTEEGYPAYQLAERGRESGELERLQRRLDELVYDERIVKAPELSGGERSE